MWNLVQPDSHPSPSNGYDRVKKMSSTLSSLQQAMSNVFGEKRTMATLPLYNNIMFTKYIIDGKNILFALLKNTPNITFDQIFDQIGGSQNDVIQTCQVQTAECSNFKPTTISSGLFPRCFRYSASHGMETNGFEDGISNGIIFIFMTGAQLMSQAYNKTVYYGRVPNWYLFTNSYFPSSSNGIRLTISHPSTNPNMDQEGLDISPGFHTVHVVALTAKEIIRLPWPYSDCTHVDYEMQRLKESVERALGSVPKYQAEDNPTYSQQECRSACLQRLIFEQCNCLDTQTRLPFNDINPSHLCIVLPLDEVHMFLEPERYNKLGCFQDHDELISQNCSFLHRIINDLACVNRVKDKFKKRKLSGDSACHCPPACYSYEYEISTSQSLWPAPGYEMSYMWSNFITFRKWNYNFGTCRKFTDCVTFKERHPINSSECKSKDREDLRFVFTIKY